MLENTYCFTIPNKDTISFYNEKIDNNLSSSSSKYIKIHEYLYVYFENPVFKIEFISSRNRNSG